MNNFYPFIHKIEKKKESEPQPIYIEIDIVHPLKEQNQEMEEKPNIIIIEL